MLTRTPATCIQQAPTDRTASFCSAPNINPTPRKMPQMLRKMLQLLRKMLQLLRKMNRSLKEKKYHWKEWNLLLRIARQNIPTALCKGGGDFGSCHLTYSFKKSLMASDNDLPSARAFACALRHSWSDTRTLLIFFIMHQPLQVPNPHNRLLMCC